MPSMPFMAAQCMLPLPMRVKWEDHEGEMGVDALGRESLRERGVDRDVFHCSLSSLCRVG
jgi:hypothetical protein